jgi:hypothetical protein
MVGSCSGDVNVLEALVAFKSELELELAVCGSI